MRWLCHSVDIHFDKVGKKEMLDSFSTNFVTNIENEKKTSGIGASLRTEGSIFMLTVDGCDHGVLVVLVSKLLKNPLVEFASAKEVHPQSCGTEILVRLTDGLCRVDLFSVIIGTLSIMSDAIFDQDGWRLEGWDGTQLVDLAEVDGRAGKAQLVLIDRDVKWANMIRRTILGGIKVLAINDVTLRCNTSILEDEVLASRIRLLPVRCGNGETLKSHHLQTCFTLNVMAPRDSARSITVVVSGAMESTCEDVCISFSGAGRGEGFMLSRLAPGQGIDIVAQVKAGTPMTNARFACVSTVGFMKAGHDHILKMRMIGQLRPSVVVNEAIRVVAESVAELRSALIRLSRHD